MRTVGNTKIQIFSFESTYGPKDEKANILVKSIIGDKFGEMNLSINFFRNRIYSYKIEVLRPCAKIIETPFFPMRMF